MTSEILIDDKNVNTQNESTADLKIAEIHSIINTNNDKSDSNLETEILSYIEQKYPDYYHESITKYKKEKIAHLSKLFNEFNDIHQEKEKHNLKWAFKKANETFNFEELQNIPHKSDCFIKYDEVVCLVNKQSKVRINRFSKMFSFLSYGVSILDIMVSVILILAVTVISHIGDHIFDSLIVSLIFISVIALIKVSLDRFAIIPIIGSYGWKWFNKAVNYTRDEAIKLNAMYLVLIESINKNENVETRFKLINKQKKAIINQRKIFSLPNFISPKPSDI